MIEINAEMHACFIENKCRCSSSLLITQAHVKCGRRDREREHTCAFEEWAGGAGGGWEGGVADRTRTYPQGDFATSRIRWVGRVHQVSKISRVSVCSCAGVDAVDSYVTLVTNEWVVCGPEAESVASALKLLKKYLVDNKTAYNNIYSVKASLVLVLYVWLSSENTLNCLLQLWYQKFRFFVL